MNHQIQFLTIKECEGLVSRYLKTDNVQVLDFGGIRLQNGNYLIKINVNHDGEKKTLDFFAKPTAKENTVNGNDIFFEVFKNAIPKFDPRIIPTAHYTNSDVTIFEDLSSQSFKCYDLKNNLLDLSHIQVALRVLAKLHAACFAYEEVKSQNTNSKYRLDQEYKLIYTNLQVKNKKLIDSIVSLEDKGNQTEFREKLLKFVDELEERQLSLKFRRTLCHGNLISNNIMFKSEKGEPIECKLLNFKSKFYAPPVYDVLQLIFFNTSPSLRQHHFQTLLYYYRNNLKKELENYTLDVEEIFSEPDLMLSIHSLLPLIKYGTVLYRRQNEGLFQQALFELKEIMDCPRLTREDCYNIVQNKLGTSSYKLLSFKMNKLGETNGFLGDYHKLQIKIQQYDKEEILNLFMKCAPKIGSTRDVVEGTGCYLKEAFFYRILVPKMQELGISTINDCVPPCYFAARNDIIVFEDMSLLNFRTLSSRIPFDHYLLAMNVKKLAKFHGSMMILEEKFPLYQEYGKYLNEVFFMKEPTQAGARVMRLSLISIEKYMIDLFPEIKTRERMENFNKVWSKLENLFYELVKPSSQFKNLFSHGDVWTNNILIKFEGDKPVDCRFVDFQNTRYCPPAQDLLLFLYLVVDRSGRIKYEEEMIKLYHDELTKVLALYNYDVESIFPFNKFLESIEYMRPQVVIQNVMYSTFCICSSEEISSLIGDEESSKYIFFEDRKDFLEGICKSSKVVRKRLQETMLDLYDLCDKFAQ